MVGFKPLRDTFAFFVEVVETFFFQVRTDAGKNILLHLGWVINIVKSQLRGTNRDVDRAKIEQQGKDAAALILDAEDVFQRGCAA